MNYIWLAKHNEVLMGSYSSEEDAYKDQCYILIKFIYNLINDSEKDNAITAKIQDIYIIAKKMISLCQQSKYVEAIQLYNNFATFNKVHIFKNELFKPNDPSKLIYLFE